LPGMAQVNYHDRSFRMIVDGDSLRLSHRGLRLRWIGVRS
jgi:hypothetical protein